MNDTGLLIAMYNDFSIYEKILKNELLTHKGAIYENFISTELVKNNFELFYFCKTLKNGDDITLELDFVISLDGKITPLEIKSRKKSAFSLNYFLNKNQNLIGYKFHTGNLGKQDNLISLPIYMISIFISKK
jgi:predicted AAA+ superfamily ATPase